MSDKCLQTGECNVQCRIVMHFLVDDIQIADRTALTRPAGRVVFELQQGCYSPIYLMTLIILSSFAICIL